MFAKKKTLRHIEKKNSGSWLRDLILGGQDGLVNVLGVVLGVSAASQNQSIIIAAALAATFAESISMTAVEYTSMLAEHDYYESELEREKREIEEVPEDEIKEIHDIYYEKGFRNHQLDEIVKTITTDKNIWLNTMMKDELNLQPVEKTKVLISSGIVGVSSLIGSLIPVFPFFFLPRHLAIPACIIFSGAALFGIGVYKAKILVGIWWKSGLQMFLIGMGAAFVGYMIGLFFHV
jgi:predicted membrane protein (TIGR00267 family)